MRHAGLDELQAGIKISGRNINNLRYVDDITLMVESKEALKNLLKRRREKEESEKTSLKQNKTHYDHGMENRRRKVGSSDRFPPLGL